MLEVRYKPNPRIAAHKSNKINRKLSIALITLGCLFDCLIGLYTGCNKTLEAWSCVLPYVYSRLNRLSIVPDFSYAKFLEVTN